MPQTSDSTRRRRDDNNENSPRSHHARPCRTVGYQAEGPSLKVNGKSCRLEPTPIYLSPPGWDVNVYHSLKRLDGGPTTGRGREKVAENLKQLVVDAVSDTLEVERHHWRLIRDGLDRSLHSLEARDPLDR